SYARKCVAYDRQPGRVSRRFADHIAPDSGRLRAIAVLLSGHAHVKLCLGWARVERERTLECRLGIRCDDAIGSRSQGFAKIGLPFSIFAVQREELAPGIHRVLETPEPEINGCQNFVAPGVVRIVLQMR